MYYIYNGHGYIGLDANNTQTTVSRINNALSFSDKQKALNYKCNLKSTLKKFDWKVIEIETTSEVLEKEEELIQNSDNKESTYVETDLERVGFDIADFFKETITTISQLKNYASNMKLLEREYNAKIKDVRHYKRDIRTKLNAIQLQRLEQFEIKLERERYECKSNRLIAEVFLMDFNRVGNANYIEVIKNIKESEYKPEILSYEDINKIVNSKKKEHIVMIEEECDNEKHQ